MSGLTRTDESRLATLRKRAEGHGTPLTEADELLLSLLEERYENFLQEGVRKLRAAGSPKSGKRQLSKEQPGTAGGPSGNSGSSGLFSRFGNAVAAKFGTSANTSPAPDDLDAGATCRHWSWLTEHLIVGAVPFASPCSDSSGHLLGLKEQCDARNVRISLVVSLLELDELDRDGLEFAAFAQPRDWEEALGVSGFAHVPLPGDVSTLWSLGGGPSSEDGTGGEATLPTRSSSCGGASDAPEIAASRVPNTPALETSFTQMIDAFRTIEGAIHPSGAVGGLRTASKFGGNGGSSAVFVHCKSGKYRSWAFIMCYLIHVRKLAYQEAKELLRLVRPLMAPSHALEVFVWKFAAFSDRGRSVDALEAQYLQVLQDALALPAAYQQRLAAALRKPGGALVDGT